MATSKARQIEILEYKINEMNTKIKAFIKFEIEGKKKDVLELKKAKYEQQLAELQA